MKLLRKMLGERKYKERCGGLDFCSLAADVLRDKADPSGFVSRGTAFWALGCHFCLHKYDIKLLLADMESRGLVSKEKKGVRVVM
jgi:hypothetical protein